MIKMDEESLNAKLARGRPSGMMQGMIWIADDFDATDPEIVQLFEGETSDEVIASREISGSDVGD
mgnify:CR=1 FL=1